MEKLYYLSKDNFLYVWQKIKLKLANKVDKIEGKGLSTNDLTDELKEKILNAGDSSFSGNYEDLTNKPDLSAYQTADNVNTAISNAIKNIQGISYSIVDTLPQQGDAGVIYLVSNNGVNPNAYDEYIWISDRFEKIGTTEVDLTDYLKKTDLVPITNAEIDEMFNTTV